MQNGSQEDQKIFEASIKALQSEIANVGVHLIIDAEARQAYSKEIVITGAGIGGIAGGALAGLACGPGAPVCVTVGAFVGGALAAFGVSITW